MSEIRKIKAKAERLVRHAFAVNQNAEIERTRVAALRGIAATDNAEAACDELMRAGYDETRDGLLEIK